MRPFAPILALLVLVATGTAQAPFEGWIEDFKSRPETVRREAVRWAEETNDVRLIADARVGGEIFLSALELRRDTARSLQVDTDGVREQVEALRRAGMYRDEDGRQFNPLLGRALERLQDLFPRRGPIQDRRPDGWTPQAEVIIGLLWTLLAAALISLAVYAWRQRRAGRDALVSDAETIRSVDEWLAEATRYEEAGDVRNAVRCLYVATLVRLDKQKRLDFVPTQTNWEHLRRYEFAPRPVASLDFRRLTQDFDRVWYGYHAQTADLATFREAYEHVRRAGNA
jgi:hypothetical protein